MLDLISPPNLCDIIKTRIVPSGFSVETGVLDGGDETDVSTWGNGVVDPDSNIIHVSEVTGAPGFDVRFTFANVIDFCRIGISAYYKGAHHCEIQIFDDTNNTWRVVWTFNTGLGFNYRYGDLPVSVAIRLADYINSNNQVLIRFYHPSSGNNAHDLFIDYVSLIG